MSIAVKRQIKESARCLSDIVWPEICEMCGGGKLISVESVTASPFAKKLDTLAGIDAWQVSNEMMLRGIASRVQYEPDVYPTFTIRASLPSGYNTELQKRLKAIEELQRGWLFPTLTIQAYLSEDHTRFIQAAIVKTKELILEAEKKFKRGMDIRLAPDGREFVVVWWRELQDAGIRVEIEYGETKELT